MNDTQQVKKMPQSNLLILGDVCPTDDTIQLFESNDYKKLFGELYQRMNESTHCIVNLEFPVVEESKPTTKCGPVLSGNLNALQTLKSAGVEYFSLANNHIGDFGKEGVRETLETCKELGLSTFGAAESRQNAGRPIFIELDGVKVGCISFAEQEFNNFGDEYWGANIFDPFYSLKQISEVKRNCDYLIILNHGGIEYHQYPSPLLQKKCRAMIDFGADLVLCQHSHCVGCEEDYSSGKIVYGQGNSIYGYRKNNSMWNEGIAIELEPTNDKTSKMKLNYIPFEWTPTGLRVLEKNSKIMEQYYSRTKEILQQGVINRKWDEFCESKKALYLPMHYGFSVTLNRINRLLKNLIIEMFYTKKQKLISMNLIRCESHKEVIETLFENEVQ